MKSFLHCFAVCVAVYSSVAGAAFGQDKSELVFSRNSAIRTAVSNNRELAVAVLEIDRAESRLRWSGRLPNPEIELSTSTDQFGLNEDEGALEIAFSQRFPITSRLKKEKIVRERDVELARLELQIRQRQLAYEADKGWIELRSAERLKSLQSELLAINETVSKFLAERAKLGEVSPLDVAQASLNGKLLEQEVGKSKAAVSNSRSRLGMLLGLDPGVEFSLADSFPFPDSPPSVALDLESVLQNRPDFVAILTAKDLGFAQLDLAMAERWDDLSVRVFAENEYAVDAPGGRERNTFLGLGISIPLPLRNKNEQAIEEAKIDIEKAGRERSAMAFAIHSELRRAINARKAAYDLADSVRTESLPLAKKNFEQFRNAQRDGQASLLQVQQAQAQLLTIETTALELIESYGLLDAEVRFMAGTYPNFTELRVTK